jgi:hypothetical protein
MFTSAAQPYSHSSARKVTFFYNTISPPLGIVKVL